MLEQRTPNPHVGGSSPSSVANSNPPNSLVGWVFLCNEKNKIIIDEVRKIYYNIIEAIT